MLAFAGACPRGSVSKCPTPDLRLGLDLRPHSNLTSGSMLRVETTLKTKQNKNKVKKMLQKQLQKTTALVIK